MKISKKKRIALIGLSALLLGMIPVFVILSNATEDNDIVMEECGTPPITLKRVDSEEFHEIYLVNQTSSYDEYWLLYDADNQAIAGLQRSYLSQGGFLDLYTGCIDEIVDRAFSYHEELQSPVWVFVK